MAAYGDHGEYATHTDRAWNDDLIEIRIYSTYRSTIRIRSLEWRDTTTDKFFYRKRNFSFSDSTVNGVVGTYASYDDSVRATFSRIRPHFIDTVGQSEMEWWEGPGGGLRSSAIAVLDYFGSKYGFHSHLHEQDDAGGYIREFRRMRRSFDGTAPSMFENQASQFTGDAAIWQNPMEYRYPYPHDVFPVDYIAHAINFSNARAWPLNLTDTCAGMIVARPSADMWAYRMYDSIYGGMPIAKRWRESVMFGHDHPVIKRFAVEADPQGWGELRVNADTNTTDMTYNHWEWKPLTNKVLVGAHYETNVGWIGGTLDTVLVGPSWYHQRPTTPEENFGHVFAAIANGITSFGTAQVFDNATPHGSAPGSFSWQKRWKSEPGWWEIDTLNHYYNFGHCFTNWSDTSLWTVREGGVLTSDVDGGLPGYYLGFSNNYKSFQTLFGRIESFWASRNGTNERPARRFLWLGSYSAHSDNQASFFLKVPATQSVVRYSHLADWGYIDSTSFDSSNQRFVEVGTFRDSNGNYAAMIVNTRLWPDPDTSKYNSNSSTPTNDTTKWVDLKDRCTASLGSIDGRKIFLRIDTSQFTGNNKNFKSKYYVVRDLEHQDSTWLVKNDSVFAIYLKPGDAKFLYFEKGVAINAAARLGTDTGKADVNDFCFNNGRRIAERAHGMREVITYTRRGKLYVSYPSVGTAIPGYFEHSGADNIATGYEQILDSVNTCAKPSICVGQNDISVALVYWFEDSKGSANIAFMSQQHPDSSWQRVECPYGLDFSDTSSDHHFVTPVLTPYNDSVWFIVAGSHPSTGAAGLFGLIATAHKNGTVTFDTMGGSQTKLALASDNPPGSAARSVFPTLASAPLPDSLYPIRLAWQQGDGSAHNRILYERWKSILTTPMQDVAVDVSKLLDACDNRHPSIAIDATLSKVFNFNATFYDDNITWESTLRSVGTGSYLTVARARHEYRSGLPLMTPGRTTWGAFDVFSPIQPVYTYHWPQVSAASRIYDTKFNYDVKNPTATYHDWIRIGWDYSTEGHPLFASWDAGWLVRRLVDTGSSHFPSIPNRTDSFSHWTDSTTVPKAVTFVNTAPGAIGPVRVTNALFPLVTRLTAKTHFIVKPKGTMNDDTTCADGGVDWKMSPTTVLRGNPKEPTTTVDWSLADIGSFDYPDTWIPLVSNEYHSEAFSIDAGDEVKVDRELSSSYLQELRDSLSTTDQITWKLTLRRLADTSYITTIDSLTIARASCRWPGITGGLDSTTAIAFVPPGWPTDSAFIMVELTRIDTSDNISRTMVEYFDSASESYSFKRSNGRSMPPSNLSLDVQPNPFNGTTAISAEVVEGAQTSVEVFDLVGKKVVVLFDGVPQSSNLNLTLDGGSLASGSYLVRVASGNQVTTRKIEHLK